MPSERKNQLKIHLSLSPNWVPKTTWKGGLPFCVGRCPPPAPFIYFHKNEKNFLTSFRVGSRFFVWATPLATSKPPPPQHSPSTDGRQSKPTHPRAKTSWCSTSVGLWSTQPTRLPPRQSATRTANRSNPRPLSKEGGLFLCNNFRLVNFGNFKSEKKRKNHLTEGCFFW